MGGTLENWRYFEYMKQIILCRSKPVDLSKGSHSPIALSRAWKSLKGGCGLYYSYAK